MDPIRQPTHAHGLERMPVRRLREDNAKNPVLHGSAGGRSGVRIRAERRLRRPRC